MTQKDNILESWIMVEHLSENSSTQTLVDEISQYGFYKDDNRE